MEEFRAVLLSHRYNGTDLPELFFLLKQQCQQPIACSGCLHAEGKHVGAILLLKLIIFTYT